MREMGRLYHNDLMESQHLELFVRLLKSFLHTSNLGRELRPVYPVMVAMEYAKYFVVLRVRLPSVLLKKVLSGSTYFP